jgi:branched-chain amino acid transport system ATP-binding protein
VTAAAELRVADLHAGYVPGHPILRGVTITAKPGRITVVLGPNGAGKSTMLRTLAGYLSPSSGTISLAGADITRLASFRHIEQGIAFLPQGRSTFPDLTVGENIELGGWLIRGDRVRLRQTLDRIFARYPVLAPLRDRPAGSLSGGQQRMVEIARLLMADPRVLLIDEPSVGLAPMLVRRTIDAIRELKEQYRLTVLMAEQNFTQAARVADRGYVIVHGRIAFAGDSPAALEDNELIRKFYLGM